MLEGVALIAALSAVAVLVYGSYVSEGGFVTDPWMVMAWYEFAPNKDVFSLSELFIQYNGLGLVRSLDFTRLAVQVWVLGSDASMWLAWQVAMCVIMSATLFLLLRMLGLPCVHALAIAALVLIFPAASSIRIWPIMGSPAAITLAILGFVCAIRAFEAQGRKGLVLHAASLALFVCSALLYESVLFVMLGSCLLYRLRVPWRAALRRWFGDVLVLGVVALLLQAKGSARGQQDLPGMFSHAVTMADQALTVFATVALPLGDFDRGAILLLLAVIPIAAIAALRRKPSADGAGALRLWLVALAGGVLVAAAGYASYVPADDYYQPLAPGNGNRLNAVPSIGYVLVVYSLVMLVVSLALRRSRPSGALAAGVGLVVCAMIGTSWLEPLSRDKEAFVLAHAEGERVIGDVREELPDPAPGSTIWALGHPLELVPGVPVFDQFGNLANRVRLAYDDPSLNSLLGPPGVWFDCKRKEIVPHGGFYDDTPPELRRFNNSRYGKTYFVDTRAGRTRVQLIRHRRDCRAAAEAFPRSPYLPGEPAPPSPPPEPPARAGGGAGSHIASSPIGGLEFAVRDGAVTGYVDYVKTEADTVYLSGWATKGDLTEPARRAVALAGGEVVAEAGVIAERPDVAHVFDNPTLARSGFVLAVPGSALECGVPAAGLKTFGITGEAAGRLLFVGGSEDQLAEAC